MGVSTSPEDIPQIFNPKKQKHWTTNFQKKKRKRLSEFIKVQQKNMTHLGASMPRLNAS